MHTYSKLKEPLIFQCVCGVLCVCDIIHLIGGWWEIYLGSIKAVAS